MLASTPQRPARRPLRWLLPGRARRADDVLFRRIARTRVPVLDAVMPRLTTAANRSALWTGIAVVMWLAGSRGRDAARRGLTAVALASSIANLVLKPLARRTRPPVDDVPIMRRLRRFPSSPSFPSGHAASAFAFATAVAARDPVPAAPLLGLAAAVGFSRVYTGAHYPSDVAAGMMVGTACGAAADRMWPPPLPPAQQRIPLPALPGGEGLCVVVNAAAGSRPAVLQNRVIRATMPLARVLTVDGDGLDTLLHVAATDAKAIGICGGDGSVAAAAVVAAGHDRPLLVVPGGTMNNMARTLGIGTVGDAARAARRGAGVCADLAMIGDRPFVNTATLGAYAELAALRHRLDKRIGKWPAFVVSVIVTLARSIPLDIKIDGEAHRVWMVFIGNGSYERAGLAPARRRRLDEPDLDVRIVTARGPLPRLRGLAGMLAARLGWPGPYRRMRAASVRLECAHETRIAVDGESVEGVRHLDARIIPSALRMYCAERP